jgi:type IV pilus assembly protein PilA
VPKIVRISFNKISKGFTLIELIAVILVLAIIALIAIPLVTTLVTEAKKTVF